MAFIAFIAVPSLRPGWDMFVLVCLRDVSHLLTGWRDDHGPTNVGAMVKTSLLKLCEWYYKNHQHKFFLNMKVADLWFDPEGDPGHHDNETSGNIGVEHEVAQTSPVI